MYDEISQGSWNSNNFLFYSDIQHLHFCENVFSNKSEILNPSANKLQGDQH